MYGSSYHMQTLCYILLYKYLCKHEYFPSKFDIWMYKGIYVFVVFYLRRNK